jgi:hypothetical protein
VHSAVDEASLVPQTRRLASSHLILRKQAEVDVPETVLQWRARKSEQPFGLYIISA